MGTIIKYCDKVVVLNRGQFVAEGEPGKMVDLYKKILAGQFDEKDLEGIGQKGDFAGKLLEESQDAQSQAADAGAAGEQVARNQAVDAGSANDRSAQGRTENGQTVNIRVTGLRPESWKERLGVNPQQLKYGDGSAQIVDVGVFDHKGELTNLLFKGRPFTIRMRVRFDRQVKDPIFAFTIKDSKGTEITGTNSMIEGCDTGTAEAGQVVTASFAQQMDLQGKDYLLSLGCTGFRDGQFVVYDRLYDVVGLTVISEKNTVGYYDMNSRVTVEKTEP